MEERLLKRFFVLYPLQKNISIWLTFWEKKEHLPSKFDVRFELLGVTLLNERLSFYVDYNEIEKELRLANSISHSSCSILQFNRLYALKSWPRSAYNFFSNMERERSQEGKRLKEQRREEADRQTDRERQK